MPLSFKELKSEKAFRENHIPKHICSASSRIETKANEVQYFRWSFCSVPTYNFRISVRKKSKGSSVCPARQRVLSSLRSRPPRLFVCPSNERAQVHLSFQFLSFHNATLWIYIVYSYLAHCIHSPASFLMRVSSKWIWKSSRVGHRKPHWEAPRRRLPWGCIQQHFCTNGKVKAVPANILYVC